MQVAGSCGTLRFTCREEKLVLQSLQFQNMGVGSKFPDGEGIKHIVHEECFINV
jgi:hypothetical protein